MTTFDDNQVMVTLSALACVAAEGREGRREGGAGAARGVGARAALHVDRDSGRVVGRWLGLSESRGNLAYVVRRKSGHEGVRPLLTIERALIG
jgi:hypothetical protein